MLTMNRALVLFDPAIGFAVGQTDNTEAFYLQVAGNQLSAVCHTAEQRTVLAMPGQNVLVRTGAITPAQVQSGRPSYVNAILIQRAGALIPEGCNRCRRVGKRPFLECRFIWNHFGGACGNCKWRDHGKRCKHGAEEESDVKEEPEDDDDPDPDPPRSTQRGKYQRKGRRTEGAGLPAPGSEANPIVL